MKPKFGGCYEVPHENSLRDYGRWLLILPSHNSNCFECRVFDAWEGGIDSTILTVAKTDANLISVVNYSNQKHGTNLDMKLRSRQTIYVVRAGHNNAVVECSEDVVSGRIEINREIPSIRDLQHQDSLDLRTQFSPGQFASK